MLPNLLEELEEYERKKKIYKLNVISFNNFKDKEQLKKIKEILSNEEKENCYGDELKKMISECFRYSNIPQKKSANEYYDLHCYYKKIGYENKAYHALYRALKLDIDNSKYIKEALAMRYCIRQEFSHDPEIDRHAKQELMEKFDDINLATSLIEKEKNNPQNYILRAKEYAKRKNYDLAVTDILSAINLGCDDWVTYELLGDHYMDNNKQCNLAIDAYSKAIEKSPFNPELYRKRGEAYFEKEYLLEALYDANQALYYDYCHKGALYLKHCICRYVNENNLMKKYIVQSMMPMEIEEDERDKYLLYLDYLRAAKNYKEELKILNYLLFVENKYEYHYLEEYLIRKIQVLAKLMKFLNIIPTAINLLNVKLAIKLRNFINSKMVF